MMHLEDISFRLLLLPYTIEIDTKYVRFVYSRVLLKSVTYAKKYACDWRDRHGSITQILLRKDTTQCS